MSRIIDVEELDIVIEEEGEEAIIGALCRYHDDRLYPIVAHGRSQDGTVGVAIRLTLLCEACRREKRRPRRQTVYLSGGMHSGAWCYAWSRGGKYLGNLRDEEFRCADHGPE
jgi:hypothetical protein